MDAGLQGEQHGLLISLDPLLEKLITLPTSFKHHEEHEVHEE